MDKVTLCTNTFEPSTWETVEVEDVREYLVEHFGIWPDTARIYLDYVANNADITPHNAAEIERLGKVHGHFFVVVYPEGFIPIILMIVTLVMAAISFLFRPSANTKAQQQTSANNSLSDRQNKARPFERIPDIFGQLWATLDLIAVPYREFVNNDEIEHCYLCIGRGSYQIDSIRDDITAMNQIEGAQVEVYGPNTSPNSGSPILTIGSPIATPVYNVQQFGAINGQILSPANLTFKGDGTDVRFESPNIIRNNGFADFTDYFKASITGHDYYIKIGGLHSNDDLARDPGITTDHLNGVYRITAVSPDNIVLDNPAAVNSNWTHLATYAGGVSAYDISGSSKGINLIICDSIGGLATDNIVGPFTMLYPQITQLWCNFVATQGCFVIDKNGNQHATSAVLDIILQQCDTNGTPIGSPSSPYQVTLTGSAVSKKQVGVTNKITLPANYAALGGIIVTCRRSNKTGQYIVNGTYKDIDSSSSVYDEVQWRDNYLITPVTQPHFGNVTTVQTVIRPTPSALAVKSRKMNALVTRKVPAWNGSSFGALTASKNAADIICAMALDPYIGKRTQSELDVVGIYNIAGPGGAIETYFAVLGYLSAVTEFCYTFDDAKVSFEESITDVATAIFCVAYRRGSVITLSFEKKTPNSTILFNHRNKIPRSETRTLTFGTLNDNDGITLEYVEPNAPNYPNLDTTTTLYFPTDQSAANPKKITCIGIRNKYQATLLGWRLFKKLVCQNTTVQFDGTEEAALLVLQDRILVADNTRSDTQDGDIINQTSLLLTLSQNVSFDARFNYTIFLQHPDQTVESIPITAGSQPNQVILSYAPSVPCLTDPANYAKTTFVIVNDAPVRKNSFLLTEKSAKDGKVYEMKAVNYDDAYYFHDTAFMSNIDVAALVIEVMLPPPPPNAYLADLHEEVMVSSPAPNADVAKLDIEVMYR